MKLMFEDDGAQLVEMFRRAKDTGVTTSLDMALPDPASAAGRASWVTILKSTLPYVDIFLPSIEEILYMLHRETYDELCRAASGPSFLPLITPQSSTKKPTLCPLQTSHHILWDTPLENVIAYVEEVRALAGLETPGST